MIVLDRGKLKFLLAGRVILVDVHREYKKGRTYAVGLTHKKTVCRVSIVDRYQLEERLWRVTVKHCVEEEPIYLAVNPGAMRTDYTSNPARAAREPSGAPIEAVDVCWLDMEVKRAAERDDLARRTRAHEERESRWRSLRPKGTYNGV